MICPRCGHDNPQGNKFCAQCGAELVLLCPSCSTPNPSSSKFCGECGSLLRSTAPPAADAPAREERRLVSVLFADLVGFTPFSESRDSEEVRTLLTTYFDRSRQIVERFGGSVDKFIGDAVMAVWGATEAREDDAERSVRAALELVDMVVGLGEEIGVPSLSLRAGVMTGETSVGPGGNEKGLVVGDLVNTASRLQSIAEPGTVFVGEPAHALTSAAIQFEDLGEQSVKGKEDPVHAFRALRVLSERGGARRTEGLEAPFTGRDVEMRLLKDQFHATGRDQSARLVSVVGEAGIGKSRLSWELEKYIDGLAAVVYWHRGRSPSYGDGLTMWALAEMVRRRAGIVDADDGAKSRLKLRTAVAEYVGSEEDRRWLEPRLAALLGLEAVPTGDREELYAAFRTFFQHIAGRGTTVLVFEDMHWGDDGLLDFVSQLVERSPRHPIFVVTLARPELLERRPGWGSGGRNSLSLHLSPLSEESMVELVGGMVPGISQEDASAIVARAGGIPLYAVEFVRMLLSGEELVEVEGGYRLARPIEGVALPESLQAVVGARFDRLTSRDRELLQDAAVLGYSFRLDGMMIIRDEDPEPLAKSLDGLVQQQLLEIDDDPRSPERGQYRFVQSVIREVAYGRLSKADRHSKHLKVAGYFEDLETSELVGAVASHYLAAHDTAPPGEASALLERGRSALSDAAARAADLQSHAAALSLLEQAIVLAEGAQDRAPLLERAALSAAWSGAAEKAIALAVEGAQLYESLGDEPGRLRSLTLQAFTLNSYFRSDEAVALLAPVFETIEDPATVEEVRLALETARAYMLNQIWEPAVSITDVVLATAEALLPPADVIDGIITRATALAGLKRVMESQALLGGAIALADEHELQAQAIRAINNHRFVRSHEAPLFTREESDDFLARTQRFGASAWVNRAMGDSVGVAIAHGDVDWAEEMLAELDGMDLSDLDQWLTDITRLNLRALQGTDAGDLEEMYRLASQFDGTADAQMIGMTSGVKAGVRLLQGDLEAAFDHALKDPSPEGVDVALICGLALRDRRRVEQALELAGELNPTGRYYRACRMLADAGRVAIDGDPAAAAEEFEQAIDLLKKIHNPFFVASMQAVFSLLVGDAHPAAERAGREARDWLRGVGYRRVEELVSDWLPPREQPVVETA